MNTRICGQVGCDRAYYARDRCREHYKSAANNGEFEVRRRPNLTPDARFWSHVDKSSDCWIWLLRTNRAGYGCVRYAGRQMLAHRVAYALTNGPIPEGMVIDHMCHRPACVNPAHLQAVTQAENNENRAGAQRHSRTGVRGVSWDRRLSKWLAQVTHKGTNHYVGHFPSLADAAAAARLKRNQLMTNNLKDRGTPMTGPEMTRLIRGRAS